MVVVVVLEIFAGSYSCGGMMRMVLGLLLALLVSCGPALPVRGAKDPMLYNAKKVAASDVVVIFVPGAVTSGDVYWRAFDWRDKHTALTFYRLPGFDGLPMDHKISIEAAANRVAAFADQYPDKEIRIVGYSLGGTVALLAAARTKAPNVKVAAIAPAPERAGGLQTVMHGALDASLSVIRARSLNRTKIWREYFEIMLHGRRRVIREQKAKEIDDFMTENEEHIVAPSQDIVRAHTQDLRHWTLSGEYDLTGARAAIFVGLEDPMFSTMQTRRFAAKLGVTRLYGYPGDGHLLLITRPEIFDQIRAFFEEDSRK